MLGNSWTRATWLAERLVGLSAENTPFPHAAASAEKQLNRWQTSKAFPQPDLWQSFLKNNAVSEELLQYLLTEPPTLLAERLPDAPKWVQRFESVYCHSTTPTEYPLPHKFTPFIAPLLHMARDTMQTWTSLQQCTMLDSATMIDQLSQSLGQELIRLINPTLVLELHAAQLQSRLDGDKSADTEQIFYNQLATPHFIRKIMREYPLLARILDSYVQDWLHARNLFFQRLAADWETMVTTLPAIKQNDRIIALDDQVSDPHCDGERVIIAALASGEKVVYKPKTIAVDVHFQTLLGWINTAGFQPALRQITVLNRPTHGWVEFIDTATCPDKAALKRFFVRQGGLLALMYVIRGTDFHYENVIAAGEHPVLIDLETLFHPDFSYALEHAGEDAVANQFRNSVMGTSLLPYREASGKDNGGMGAANQTFMPERARNLPTLIGESVDMLAYSAEFLAGFEQMYALFHTHQATLLSDASPLHPFKNAPIRIILRSSVAYDALLRNLIKPNQLRNGLEQGRMLNLLWASSADHHALQQAIAHESRDLLRNNIPYFYTFAGSRDLFAADGTRISNFFTLSGFELVQQRIMGLGSADFAQQQWYIKAALATLVPTQAHWSMPTAPLAAGNTPINKTALDLAIKVGQQLDKMQLGDADEVAWVGLNMLDKHWYLHPIDIDLHNGLAGIAIFYAQLGAISGDPHWTQQANKTTNSLLYWTEEMIDNLEDPGLHYGWGGVILALTTLGKLWDADRLINAAEQISNYLLESLENTQKFDLAHGLAGGLLSLLALNKVSQATHLLPAIRTASARLLAYIGQTQELPLGLANGQAGIMLALAQSGQVLADARLLAGAQTIAENILRQSADIHDHSILSGWAGIGLAASALSGTNANSLVSLATQQAYEHGFGQNHSLIHGDLGTLDFLLTTPTNCTAISQQLIATITRDGFQCGTPFGLPTPGFLHGLAGIGYGLLRCAQPTRIPSLWLGQYASNQNSTNESAEFTIDYAEATTLFELVVSSKSAETF